MPSGWGRNEKFGQEIQCDYPEDIRTVGMSEMQRTKRSVKGVIECA